MINTVLSINTLKHISFTSAQEIQDICAPLSQHLKILCFDYACIFPDGSRAVLSNNAELLDHSYLKKKLVNDIYIPDFYGKGITIGNFIERIQSYPDKIKKKYEKQLATQNEFFNITNEVGPVSPTPNHVKRVSI